MDWSAILQSLNTTALVVFAFLMARGYLVPMPTVAEYMLAPRDQRIAALEQAVSRRDEQYADLARQMAAAVEAQGRAIQVLQQSRDRGGD